MAFPIMKDGGGEAFVRVLGGGDGGVCTRAMKVPTCVCVCVCACVCCVCVFIKLHITAQSGPVILVILCHSQ